MDKPQKVVVVITNRTIIRLILWIIAATLGFRFFGHIQHELILIFSAAFLALALNPVVSNISKRLRSRSRARATAMAYLLVVSLLTAFFLLVIPPLVTQTRTFIQDVPQTVENFQNQDSSLSRTIYKYNLNDKLDQASKDFADHYSDFGEKLLDTSKRVAEAVISFLVVLVLAFMMLVEGPKWMQTYFKALPAKRRTHHEMLAKRMYRSVTGFVNGQLVLAIIAGTFAAITLEITSHIFGVSSVNAVALGGIVAVFGIIPLFGNPLAATIVILSCLLNNSVTMALVMLVYFVIYFFIENHTLQPYLQSRFNELTPLTVFIAAIIGVGVAGFLGAIVAIPAASTIKILVTDYYQRHKLTPDIPETKA
jgi:predicted PurR-regulated permease PerM